MLKDLIHISHYAGCRFDLTQVNGGNSSVKIENFLYIKSSGCYLSDLTESYGIAKVKLKPLQKLLQHPEKLNDSQIKNAIYAHTVGANRPSIETGMHVRLGTFVLHTHPLAVNALSCHKDWQKLIAQLFPEAICIAYTTPGAALAIAVAQKLHAVQANPKQTLILFLQNHGLVVSAMDAATVINKTEQITTKIEQTLNLDFTQYQTAAKVCALLKRVAPQFNFCHCANDQDLQQILTANKNLFFAEYCLPIAYLYNTLALELVNLEDEAPIRTYIQHHQQAPQVIIYRNHIYLITSNIHQASELESVLKEHLLIQQIIAPQTRSLTATEIMQLKEDMSL